MLSNTIKNNLIKFIFKPNKFNINQSSKLFYTSNNNNGSGISGEINQVYENSDIKNQLSKDQIIKDKALLDFDEIIKNKGLGNFIENDKLFKSINLDLFPPNRKQRVYKEMLFSYSKIPNMKECESVFQKIGEKSASEFTIMCNGYLRENNFEKAIEYLQLAIDTGKFDIKSFGFLINKLSKSGQYKFVERMLSMIKDNALKPDRVIYYSIFKNFINLEKTDETKQRLLSLYQTFKKDLNVSEYDELLFSSIINVLYKFNLYEEIYQFYKELFCTSELYYMNNHLISKFWIHLMMFSIISDQNYNQRYSINNSGDNSNSNNNKCLNEINSFYNLIINDKYVFGNTDQEFFYSYIRALNVSIKNGYASVDQVNLPQIIEDYFEILGKSPNSHLNSIITKENVVSNEVIFWYLLRDDIVSAWGHFQHLIKSNIANVYSFYYILDYLSKKCTNDIIYNNIKEIITSSYYINLASNSNNYKNKIWLSILRSLLDKRQYNQLKNLVTLLKTHTFENLNYYSSRLKYDLNKL